MPLLTPDPTFYPSPAMAAQAPPETFAYLALINPRKDGVADAMGVVTGPGVRRLVAISAWTRW